MSKQFIITNRPIIYKDGQEQINIEDDALNTINLRFGYYDMEMETSKASDRIQLIPELPINEKNKKFRPTEYNNSIEQKDKKGSEIWFDELFHQMKEYENKNDTLIFIHGFSCGFECLEKNLRHLYESYVLNEDSSIARIVAYSWPSNDTLLEYKNDADDAEIAGKALARGFHKLIQFFNQYFNKAGHEFCGSHMHLLCHSMGNQVFEHMIKSVLESNLPYGQVFKEIILAAPDVDHDVFEKGKPLAQITNFCERVHVYTHNKDKALVISDLTKNKKARLGKNGPSNPFTIPHHVNMVDATSIKDQKSIKEKFVDHWYYKDSDTVIYDIGQVLNGDTAFSFRKNKTNYANYFELNSAK